MGILMMNDELDGYKYDKTDTVNSPVVVSGTIVDYAYIVSREGGDTQVRNVSVIDMDAVKDSMKSSQKPSSMDLAFVISKENAKSQKKQKKYICADLKFKITSPNKVDKNITNDSIKAKYSFSSAYIRSKDTDIPLLEIAYFIFGDKNFEQIKNAWKRRGLNRPKNNPIKQSEFERLF